MRTVILIIIFSLSACATQEAVQPGAAEQPAAMDAMSGSAADEVLREDVDADYEAMFEEGNVSLKTVAPDGGNNSAVTMAPFSRPLSSRATPAGDDGALFFDGTPNPNNALQFHVFSIGQADSMLVIGPPPESRTMLVDLGELNWNSRRNCLHVRDRIEEITGDAHVDYLVITHFHMDHTGSPTTELSSGRVQEGGGIFCLLDGSPDVFTVGALIDRGDGESQFKPDRQRIHQAIIDSTDAWIQNGTLTERIAASFATNIIDLGNGVDVEIISTAGKVSAADAGALARAEQSSPGTYTPDSQASPNDFSVGIEISAGDFEFVTAGDLTGSPGDPPYGLAFPNGHGQIYTNVESHMVEFWNDPDNPRESDVEIYRVNHHGSQNSSTADLADALRPEVVIYSAGGRYGHPKKSIADRFLAMDADQMLTTSADDDEWADGVFPPEYGNGWLNPVGEIFIHVPIGGDSYTISTAEQSFEYPVMTDAEEAAAGSP